MNSLVPESPPVRYSSEDVRRGRDRILEVAALFYQIFPPGKDVGE
jgi:hypothetical protein